METQHDLLAFIGRFQPFHGSHFKVLELALSQSENVLILIGSSNASRSTKNPFTYEERQTMIRASIPDKYQSSMYFAPVRDFIYVEELWPAEVQAQVMQVAGRISARNIGIIGHKKDESSYYLDMFPQWDLVEAPDFGKRSATELRQLYFTETQGSDLVLSSSVPEKTMDFLQAFRQTSVYGHLKEEFQFVRQYREQFANAPYPPTFVTVDAVVVHSGHILLVERRANPGKGLLALPGGFLGQSERLEEAMLRELHEETRLKIPEKVLRGSIAGFRVFDDPGRSQRGRTITNAFYLKFPTGPLPKIRGGDDAAKAAWVPLNTFYTMAEGMFEDHWHIASSFIGMGPESLQ